MPVIGCLGCGNMGSALMAGFAARLDKSKWTLRGFDPDAAKAKKLNALGVEIATAADKLASECDILIYAVKPGILIEVMTETGPSMKPGCVAVSVAAGVPLNKMRVPLGAEAKIARVMPTLTASVGRGIFAFCFDPNNFDAAEQKNVLSLFSQIGVCSEIPESRFNAFAALIGAGPAYVYEFMQGLCQAGLTVGFPRSQCGRMLVELFAGCAEMARVSEKPFMELRDDTCSPGGLTVAGVNVLDRAGTIGLVTEAVVAAKKRADEMGS